MPKKTIKKFLPDHQKIKSNRYLSIFGEWLHKPNLWHLNRRSAANAFAIGLFFMFIPLPAQMILAAFFAIIFSANIALSVALVWISNPLTMPVMFYFAYKIGAYILHIPNNNFEFELSWKFLSSQMTLIGYPLLLGSLICASVSSLIGYFSIRFLWRLSIISQMKKRKKNNR